MLLYDQYFYASSRYLLFNSFLNISVVSLSKLVNLILYNLRVFLSSVSSSLCSKNFSAAVNIICAHIGLGKPKIPEEMAGIDTDLQFRWLALFKVLYTALKRSLCSPFLPCKRIHDVIERTYIIPDGTDGMYDIIDIFHLTSTSDCNASITDLTVPFNPFIWLSLNLPNLKSIVLTLKAYCPPLRIMAPATPPPCLRNPLAAFVIASTFSSVISPKTTLTSSTLLKTTVLSYRLATGLNSGISSF